MDRLVTVDAKELHLHLDHQRRPTSNRSRRPSAAFRVTNVMHTMSVAVHLTTTRPSSFSVSPASVAILPPLSSSAFSLLFTPEDDFSSPPPLVSPPDSLLVRTVLLPTGKADPAALLRLFTKPGVHVFKDAVLPISFVGLDAALCLLHGTPPLTTQDAAFLLSKAAAGCSPADLSSLLLRAASSGSARFVSTLVEAGADANTRSEDDGSGRSPLSLAVASGSLETVDVLLDSGAAVDASSDRCLMHDAASEDRVDIMAALSPSHPPEWGESADALGRTPLHTAAMNGHLGAARFCVSHGGADPDRTDASGWMPLHFAAAGGFLDVAEFLLESSSYSKYALTGDGRRTPFDLAADAGHAHMHDLLRLGDTMSRAARASDDVSVVWSCLSQGAEVDRRDQNGWTALHRAAFKGRSEVVKVLVENGAKVDAMDDAGYSPLRLAAEAGHAEVALWLVARVAASTGMKELERLRFKLDRCGADAATKN